MDRVAVVDAMREAIRLAQLPPGPWGGNPRVGCVIVSPEGEVVGTGAHEGAGTPHAEVAALAVAGARARGAAAVVTLEPCAHSGRTGPCTTALIEAGVARVFYASSDPNPLAAGGAQALESAGITVEGGVLAAEARAINEKWLAAMALGRPYVTLKIASTLDGQAAAADGTSRWITGPAAREQVHRLRSEHDVVLVGTGTVIADDPDLTDRRPDAKHQPQRVVLGSRPIPVGARLDDDDVWRLTTHDVLEALSDLFGRGVRSVLVEGGPTVAGAFISADLVDHVVWFVAPALLGRGMPSVEGLAVATIGEAVRWTPIAVAAVGDDVRIDLSPTKHGRNADVT